MKTISTFGLILAWLLIALANDITLANDVVRFKPVTWATIGHRHPDSFKFTEGNRGIIKFGDHKYVVLELLDVDHKDDGATITATSKVVWTLISPSGVQGGTKSISVQLRRSDPTHVDDLVLITKFRGTDLIEIGDIAFRWSPGSSTHIFLHPGPGTEFATINVEPNAAGQPATRSESK